MKRLVALALGLVACHSSTDIAPGCDELKGTCKDAWALTLRTTTAGAYVIAVTLADGTKNNLTCTLPGTCTSSDASARASIVASGLELVEGRSSSTFAIAVTRDGSPILARTFAPSYAPYTPNGADCPPMCAGASDVVDLP